MGKERKLTMNEKIKDGQEMGASGRSVEQVISVVLGRMLETRPRGQVEYRPYEACGAIAFTRALGAMKVDCGVFFPEAEVGDGVFTDFYVWGNRTETIYLNVSPGTRVWYEGNCIYDGLEGLVDTGEAVEGDTDRRHLPIALREGQLSPVRILCVKTESGFGYEFLLSVKRYPGMWANDYLLCMRALLPMAERKGEEGVAVSVLYGKEQWSRYAGGAWEPEYVWPPQLPGREDFDFQSLYGTGEYSYVYTEAAESHVLTWQGNVEAIFRNGKQVPEAGDGSAKEKAWPAETGVGISGTEAGSAEAAAGSAEGKLSVKAGDRLLFVCRKGEDGWCLRLETAHLKLPFLKSHRGKTDRAVCIGPFGANSPFPESLTEEGSPDWSRVYPDEQGEEVYWKFCDGSEMRIYLDSVFFGQWFYALMVGFYGIRDASLLGADESGKVLFDENMLFLARYFDYVEYDISRHKMPAFMPRIADMDVLDNIGTMGMNLLDAYFDTGEESLLPLIRRIQRHAEEGIPRMEDGTYYRIATMWADDLYMSCPFLIRMGRLTGDLSWFEKAKKQIRGFRKRLYMEEEGIFSHIYFVKEGKANRIPWGRGNGWVMWTLSELLLYGEGRVELEEEKKLFCEMAQALRGLQDESGIWRQVLNRKDEASYLETSCTGMFLLAFVRGLEKGWLGAEFRPCVHRAWKGLLEHSIDREGNVYGVCMGSGCAMDAEYYFTIPTAENDDHGTGVILAAAAEYRNYCREA